ncbi:hypothetical protein DHEL01_v202504 [Diaporthe helianthi]|uniref:AAA+ ATPase lid domain-containing protein n=1 Tax=Diaporthe helianthi TaxID=158607 RepID=A0A2P5I9E1_DIAHE|nr:hypothetical protein DHEL01_v202504 [Diaporthe helianthi]
MKQKSSSPGHSEGGNRRSSEERSGIRPGVLDEAVKSRVHLALKYDHLNLPQTEALFEFNMQRLKEIEDKKGSIDRQFRKLHPRKKKILTFAREHYEKSMAKQGVGQWNGRQIRNAFLIAAYLAHYGDGEEEGEAEDDELQKQLGRTHFEKVDKTTLLCDQYRREMLNRDDDSRAHEQEER